MDNAWLMPKVARGQTEKEEEKVEKQHDATTRVARVGITVTIGVRAQKVELGVRAIASGISTAGE